MHGSVNSSEAVLIFINSTPAQAGRRQHQPTQNHDAATDWRGPRKRALPQPFPNGKVPAEHYGATGKSQRCQIKPLLAPREGYRDQHRRMRQEHGRHGGKIAALPMRGGRRYRNPQRAHEAGNRQQNLGQQFHVYSRRNAPTFASARFELQHGPRVREKTMSDNVASVATPAAEGWAEELRATFSLAWPLAVAQLAQNALHTTDVILLGWLGPTYLAAGTLGTTFFMPFLLFGVGVVGAVAPLVAQARGARNIKAIRRIVRQGFWVAILLAVLLLPVVMQIRPIYQFLGQDPTVTGMAEQFVQIAAWSLFPALGIIALRSFLSAFDATRAVLVITVLGVVVNALVAYALIFGNFGMPRLELRGAATATLLTNIVMFVVMLVYVVRHRRFHRFNILMRFWKPDWGHFRAIFVIGTPIALTVLAEVGMFTAAALLMGRLGTDEVAAHAVALQCASIAFMVPLGLGIAATVRVGIAYGRQDREGIRKAGWMSFMLGTGFMVLSCMAFLLLSGPIVSLFLNPEVEANANAVGLAVSFLAIAGIFQLVDGAQVTAAHALRGLSDTKVPMLLAILGYWLVGLPTSYVLGFVLGWRGVGIWTGLAVGLTFVAIVLVTRFALRERLGLLEKLGPKKV
jgi:putative efflux protein, MATE family